MYRLSYGFLIFLLTFCFTQEKNSDIYFLDMGVAIQPKNDGEKTARLIKPNLNTNVKNMENTKSNGAIYMATTSEVFSSLGKVSSHLSDLEKSLNTKIGLLERENSRLRNQVVNLKKKLNSQFISLDQKEILKIKPVTNDLNLIENKNIGLDMSKEDRPLDKPTNISVDQTGFDESRYESGVISYSKENYGQCIKYLKELSLIGINERISGNILLMLADSFEQTGRYKQSIKQLEKLSKLDSEKYSDLVLLRKGIIFRNIGMNSQAHGIFKKLVENYPQSEYAVLAQEEINSI
tara:strand:+ start:375 stop:1253 length:879 start_codon:yes stop_codon:yes gene_type:complete